MDAMMGMLKKNVVMFVLLSVAALTLFAGWSLQQPNPLIVMDSLQSLMVSGILTGVTAVMATAVGLGLAARRD
jgi:hypothetical protein